MDRRHFLMSSTVAGVAALAGCAGVPGGPPWTGAPTLDAEVEEQLLALLRRKPKLPLRRIDVCRELLGLRLRKWKDLVSKQIF